MSLSSSLLRFLSLYEFDPGATDFALDHMVAQILSVGDSGAYITKEERTAILKRALSKSRFEILKKTLIDVGHNDKQLDQLADDLANQGYDKEKWVSDSTRARALIYCLLQEKGVTLSFNDEVELQRGLEELDADARTKQVQDLSNVDIPTGLARWFARNLDAAASAIIRMDDTDFATLVPSVLQQAFRECHINAAIGNHGTTIILCGVILERGLKDLMNDDAMLDQLIESAGREGLLVGGYFAMAHEVKNKRNTAAHKLTFSDSTSQDAWAILGLTRKLILHLYRDRD